MTKVSDELKLAYQQTRYIVEHEQGEWVLKIGEEHALFTQWLSSHKISTWAFITAYNPFSKSLSDKENEVLQSLLEKKLRHNNFKFWQGRGQGQGDWPPEKSVFIANISLEYARKLAKEYEQNSFVFGEIQHQPKLIFTV